MTELNTGSVLQERKYTIEKVLGKGGFGITYLAEQTMLGRKVAIKEFFMKEYCERDESTSHVSIPSSGSQELVKRYREKFLKEARNIAKLKHQHIVRIMDVFEENGTAYYVMEYMEGGSLSDKVKNNKAISEKKATQYILQLAEAIDYIHKKRINHLDIKPGNVLLDENDNVVLIDFGLSKQYDTEGMQTSTTPVGISEGYAPMEQYKQGGVSEFSPEADIYALGATYFKLLTGINPPSASDIYEDGVPVDVLRAKGVNENIINAICKSMEPKKKDRYHSVSDFIKALTLDNSEPETEITVISAIKEKKKNKFEFKYLLWIIFPAIVVVFILLYNGCNHKSSQYVESVDSIGIWTDSMYYNSSLGAGIYSGYIDKNGMPDGNGSFIFNDGRKYSGSFVHGEMEGDSVVFMYDNGDEFRGKFYKNEFKMGRYTIKSDGSYFYGTFKNGQPDKGEWYSKNGVLIPQ